MTAVVLDTDVASLSFKRRLPAALLSQLTGREPIITFITLGELLKWTEWRSWGPSRRAHLSSWLNGFAIVHSTDKVAGVWGEISAFADRRGRPRPSNDTWIAACCLAHGLPLATLNTKDFSDFAEHEGLTILSA
ncbi:MAG: type II toxin-antitoxin system VapC family toxin [Pseudonocardiaceae bacterium]